VIDDGLYPDDPEIAGRVHPSSRDIISTRNTLAGPGTHGTELAAFIAGGFNGASTVGVAYEATILAVRADREDCFGPACSFRPVDLAAALDYAVREGVDVVNFSLGATTPSGPDFEAALRRATQAGVIVVASAGNEGTRNPAAAADVNYPGRYAGDPTISNGLIIAAGAHDEQGRLVSFSNRAGSTQNFYVMAPGVRVYTVDAAAPGETDPAFQRCVVAERICEMQGTSYASPHVAGAVALLLQAFPGLTSRQIVDLVLTSADDADAVGVDAETGRGRLNVANAFNPRGTVLTPLFGAGVEIGSAAPIGQVGPAFGDAFARGAWATVGFDAYGRTFERSLAGHWRSTPRPNLAEMHAPGLWRARGFVLGPESRATVSFAAPPVFAPPSALDRGRTEEPRPAMTAQVSLSPMLTLTAAANAAPLEPGAPGPIGRLAAAPAQHGAALTLAPVPGLSLALSASSGADDADVGVQPGETAMQRAAIAYDAGGVIVRAAAAAIQEEGQVLGLGWDARYGAAPEGRTGLAHLAAEARIAPGLKLEAQLERGWTVFSGAPWLAASEAITTSAARIGLGADMAALGLDVGRLTIALEQPLRVETGALTARLADADAYGRRALVFRDWTFSAEPTGRQRDLSVGYSLQSGERLTAAFSVVHRHEPGHRKDAPDETEARMGLRFAY
jgi:hypothetical protein